jgi:esterase/lipase superfamily enzyme
MNYRLFLLCAWLVCSGIDVPLAVARSGETAVMQVEIPFLTSRRTSRKSDGEISYSTDSGDLSAGHCQVRLLQGEALDAQSGPLSARPLESVMSEFAGREGQGILFYIHGYNIGLERACRDAARLAHVTGFDGRVLLFSWPASQAVVTYRKDEQRLTESLPAILSALHALGARHGYDNVNIVAHSMGTRVTLALNDPPAGASPSLNGQFRNLVLVAPDIDRDRFLEMLPSLQQRAESISILVSEDDRLLLLSQIVNGEERLGQASDLTVAGVDVVDVSTLDDLGLTGHIYHLENNRVGDILRAILAPLEVE